MKTNLSKGKYGEMLAKDYILSKGYKILELNYRTKLGEIDIIALDKNIIVCIEVKTRSSKNFGYAFEAVDLKKQRKIINTSNMYIQYKQIRNVQIRYDIIEVYLKNKLDINHIENAFCL